MRKEGFRRICGEFPRSVLRDGHTHAKVAANSRFNVLHRERMTKYDIEGKTLG
jgi:hypothetical protein